MLVRRVCAAKHVDGDRHMPSEEVNHDEVDRRRSGDCVCVRHVHSE